MDSLKINSIADPTSEFIKTKLVNMFPTTSARRWKRIKKGCKNSLTIREFQHGNIKVSAVYNPSERELELTEITTIPQHFLAVHQLIDRTDLYNDDTEKDYSSYTGNVAVYHDEEAHQHFSETGEFSFYLGVEETNRQGIFVSDCLSMNQWLQETLSPWIKENNVELDIGAAENYHILIPGHTSKRRLKSLFDDLLTTLRSSLPTSISLNEHEI